MTFDPKKPPRWSAPKVGDRVPDDNGALYEITHVWPILSKGSPGGGKVVEVKIIGYGLGLRRVRVGERTDAEGYPC